MPQVVFYFKKPVSPSALEIIGKAIQLVVAEACSTDAVRLDPKNDVDWVPTFLPPSSGAIIGDASVEIHTIGYPDRRKKLDSDEVLLPLKEAIFGVLVRTSEVFLELKPENPLVWVRYTDGRHV